MNREKVSTEGTRTNLIIEACRWVKYRAHKRRSLSPSSNAMNESEDIKKDGEIAGGGKERSEENKGRKMEIEQEEKGQPETETGNKRTRGRRNVG